MIERLNSLSFVMLKFARDYFRNRNLHWTNAAMLGGINKEVYKWINRQRLQTLLDSQGTTSLPQQLIKVKPLKSSELFELLLMSFSNSLKRRRVNKSVNVSAPLYGTGATWRISSVMRYHNQRHRGTLAWKWEWQLTAHVIYERGGVKNGCNRTHRVCPFPLWLIGHSDKRCMQSTLISSWWLVYA